MSGNQFGGCGFSIVSGQNYGHRALYTYRYIYIHIYIYDIYIYIYAIYTLDVWCFPVFGRHRTHSSAHTNRGLCC